MRNDYPSSAKRLRKSWIHLGVALGTVFFLVVTGPTGHAATGAATVGNGLTTSDLNSIGMSANTLASLLIDPASGITGINSVVFTGNKNQAGSIHVVDPNVVSFNDGVILSSGNIADVVGPNKSDSTTTDEGNNGDADLDQLIQDTQTVFPATYDAASLSFKFTAPVGASDLYFTYVFGSDEYLEWVNLYNDVFGLFVNGQNCAVAPNPSLTGTVPVSIDTINSAVNTNLFRDNAFMTASNPLNFESDGLSVEMVCHAQIHAGENTIKFVIADTSDRVLDSIVMIKSGSFSTTPIESCNNKVDDDGDNAVDMDDTYCTSTTVAAPAGTSLLPVDPVTNQPVPVADVPTAYGFSSITTPPFTGNEGSPILLDANFKGWTARLASAPGEPYTVSTSWTVKLKSNNSITCQITPSGTIAHTYGTYIELASAICPQDGEYIAQIVGMDSENSSDFDYDIDFFVHNAPPSVAVDASTTYTAGVDETVNFVANVSDPGGDATTCAINWGDGSPESTPVISGGTCEDSHTYSSLGTKIVSVKASDNVNATAAAVAAINIAPPFVATAPDAPSITGAIAGDTTVELSWSAPANDGGAIIDMYSIFQSETVDGTYVSSSATCAALDSLTCTVDSLVNGTTYYFKVMAHNSVDWSVLSAASDGVVPAITGLDPTFGSATPTEDGFTLQIQNFDTGYIWAGTNSELGSVSISDTGLITVTGLGYLVSSTVTITTSLTGYLDGTATSETVTTLDDPAVAQAAADQTAADAIKTLITNSSWSLARSGYDALTTAQKLSSQTMQR